MANEEVAAIVLAEQPATTGPCALCARDEAALRVAVMVQRGTGASAAFSACEYCERALRRLAAAVPGLVRFVTGGAGPRVVPATALPMADDLFAVSSELVLELSTPVQDASGRLYVARVYGAQREDGTWIGWLEFVAADRADVLYTNRETTQPNRAALLYWASGLQPSYLEGAFARALRSEVASPA
jgi:hypothetical protein